ncbi:hypothetical protein BDQ12DRAFT_737413 [Crucibulum laeve]|uniref:F-box domain-containing protein n=1 Tax=Crucibulum laeve TaxID=68775 RepID=A0A5C3LTI5_9AGAR|nr:hypothetical protein BDQ12DRAFT_737413 [Crucibulum laeve]
MPTMTLHIPPELLRPLINHIDSDDRPTLLSLMKSSRSLRFEAERLLYRRIVSSDVQLQTSFLNCIILSPRLARLVEKYSLVNPRIIEDTTKESFFQLLSIGLQEMTNLKHLNFREYSGQPSAHILRNCVFQLESLDWGCHSESEIDVFLSGQKALRRLSIEWDAAKLSIPLTACPNLVSLSGGCRTIEAFMPGRQITSLHWIPELYGSTLVVDSIRNEFARLINFSFGGYFRRPHLAIVAPYLKSLEILELITLSVHFLHIPLRPQTDSISLQQGDLDVVFSLKTLRTLIISPQWGTRYLSLPIDGRQKIVENLFENNKALQSVYISRQGENSHIEHRYQKWIRGAQGPTIVSHPGII